MNSSSIPEIKKLQSPSHLQKKQESVAQTAAKQILNQVPSKNLRNPDYYITSILTNPEAKKIDLNSPVISKKGQSNNEYSKLRKDFEASLIENLKREKGPNVKPEDYKAEMANFQKNYEEFFRGYTPDVNSFKRYESIKTNMNQGGNTNKTLEQLNNDPDFKKNMNKFFAIEGQNSSITANNSQFQTTSKLLSPSRKDVELVKSIQNCKYNPITGKQI